MICNQTWESLNIHENLKTLLHTKRHIKLFHCVLSFQKFGLEFFKINNKDGFTDLVKGLYLLKFLL